MFRNENVCYICCFTTYKGMLRNNEQLETPNSTNQQRETTLTFDLLICVSTDLITV